MRGSAGCGLHHPTASERQQGISGLGTEEKKRRGAMTITSSKSDIAVWGEDAIVAT